jgi:hypothetical protein
MACAPPGAANERSQHVTTCCYFKAFEEIAPSRCAIALRLAKRPTLD